MPFITGAGRAGHEIAAALTADERGLNVGRWGNLSGPGPPGVLILYLGRLRSDPYLMGAHVRRLALAAALAMSAGLLAACGGSVHLAAPGWHTFQIYNAAAEGAEVDLVNPGDGAVYAEVEALGPGTTSPMRLDVGSGSYAFRCLFEDFDPITGPTVTVSGQASGTPAILPVTNDDLYGPERQYHAYIAAGLDTLASQARAVAADVRDGNLGAAKAAWLTAHLTYERLPGRPTGVW